ncbi:hypothetical protein CAQUA_00030 [Corynebacterium aquatimens]|nr:hypothetical protein CAQUA_00030 [Corynebacterium aquatimens]
MGRNCKVGYRNVTEKVGAPAFLAVITGTEYAYTLPSGVHVIPLGVLGA